MSQSDLSGRLARWSIKLQGFRFSIEHRKGSENIVAVALSRSSENEIAFVDLDILPEVDVSSDTFRSLEYEDLKYRFLKSNLPDLRTADGYLYYRAQLQQEDPKADSGEWKFFAARRSYQSRARTTYFSPLRIDRNRRNLFWPNMVVQTRN